MGDHISASPARARVGKRVDGRRKPPDFADSDVVDAILVEVEWEEEGNSDAALDGWWSDRWGLPPRDSLGDD
jgi:hypothetical protein